MPYPTKFTRQYDYAAWQASNPTKPLPGNRVNVDLDAQHNSTSEIIDFLKTSMRSDGRLQNGSVGVAQLDSSFRIGFSLPTTWLANTAYTADSTVLYANKFWHSRVAHTSTNTFDESKWDVIVDFGAQATAAASSASAASASATAASGSASSAGSSASASSTSATAAAGSASAAAGSATAASGSATAAAGSATSAGTSATAAAASAAAAALVAAPIATGKVLANLSGSTAAAAAQTLTPFTVEASGYASLAAAISAIGSTQATLVIGKNYTLAANTTFPKNISLVVLSGGGFTKASSYTLAINGPFVAAPAQIFFGFSAGNVTFGTAAAKEAYAEWWGADNTGAVDSATAINCALQSTCRVVQLLTGSYLVNTSINPPSYSTLTGVSGNKQPQTMLYTNSATIPVLDISGANDPLVSVDKLNVDIKHLYVYRGVDPAAGAIGIRIYKTLRVSVSNCFVHRHETGITIRWTVNTDCLFINVVGHGGTGGTTVFNGFDIDCSDIAAVAPNASSRLTDCGVSGLGSAGTSYGFYIHGRYADQFLLRCEAGLCTIGFYVLGTNSTSERILIDVHLNGCVSDSFYGYGFVVQNGARYSAVQLTDCYAAANPAATGDHVLVDNNPGTIITNMQIIGLQTALGACRGLFIQNSSNCTITGVYLQDCAYPVLTSGSQYLKLQGLIYNGSQAAGATYAVNVSTTSKSSFDFVIGGAAAGQFTNGYYVDAASTNNELNVTAVNTSAVTNPVNVNSVAVTSESQLGGNTLVGNNLLTKTPVSYTLVPAAQNGGTFTYTVIKAKYLQEGKRITLEVRFLLLTVGTAAQSLTFNLPVIAASAGGGSGGRESASQGYGLAVSVLNTSSGIVNMADKTTPFVAGYELDFTLVYFAA